MTSYAVLARIFLLLLSGAAVWVMPAQIVTFQPGVALGKLSDKNLKEASGLIASRNNPSVLWTHNDGPTQHLYAISTNGTLLADFAFPVSDLDFEDIAIGPGPKPELDYIYAGDIGDNFETRGWVQIFRMPEPAVYPYFGALSSVGPFKEILEINLVYPDGPHNAEALFVDPQTGDLFIATKEPDQTRVYRATKAQLESAAKIDLTRIATLPFQNVSGSDISPKGNEIILRREDAAVLFKRFPGQSIADALNGAPAPVPVIGPPLEPNGEGISFDQAGVNYFTVGEGVDQPLHFFQRTSPAPAGQVPLVSPASEWRYSDKGMDLSTAWQQPDFDDSNWKPGLAQLGYGEGDEQTVISFGPSADHKYVTTYFRKKFPGPTPGGTAQLLLKAVFDDGIAVYLNGIEVLRVNLPAGAGFAEPASSSYSKLEDIWQTFMIPAAALRPGANCLAVEVHRYSPTEKGLSFDLQLSAVPPDPPLRFPISPQLVSGAWQLEITGPFDGSALLEDSSDLINWLNPTTVFLTNGQARISQPASARFPRRFFRLRNVGKF